MRSLFCAFFGIVVVLVLLAFTPKHNLSPKGIVLPATQKTFAAMSPSDVVIYHQSPEQSYQVVAQIRAEQGFKSPTNEKTKKALLSYVKNLAASVGANGVIVKFFVPDNGVQKAFTFIGEAIRLQSVAKKKEQ